ncbi:hypothetical protein HN695_05010 [Candidatus Woesearchaeota archaeon]|jgi:NOL1/NOP2/fmu family ribosome biogenesis protein|nr:hypothetical protein [Candidatus Woesearchaeota archaeon]MBT5272083.1 hypothetical protein [Candidatus Woesearchaeota archaeon]MBT6041833.1 hypothetical protein [Candidatus Woesearchaeota archaeon]MBT6336792.1 hypothetical protein [Candidatus Woesearchaeota archaeon]MBT7927673.1 hypothetical protein [Candidatus Woesearchaeota archaeon]
MARAKFLNKKQIKEIISTLDKQWGLKEKDFDYVFLINDKNKIFVISQDITEVNFDALRIDSMGSYFAEQKNNELRLSIEGSQIIGKIATKNVIEISDGLTKLWVRGYDIEVNEYKDKENAFVIVKNKEDFYGCGRLKEGKILNHVPKSRRIKSED